MSKKNKKLLKEIEENEEYLTLIEEERDIDTERDIEIEITLD